MSHLSWTKSICLSISWTSVTDATGYKIYRADTDTGTYEEIGTSATETYENTGLASGSTYYYRVTAMAAACESVPSTSAMGTTCSLAAPTNVTASLGSFVDKIVVSWTLVASATGYKIYRSDTDTGTYTEIGTSATETYENIGLAAGSTFYYKVSVTDTVCESAPSASEQGSTWQSAIGNLYRDNINWSLPDTGQTTNYYTGDDATYGANPKNNYTDNGDGTISDTITSLMWEKDPGGWSGTWADAITHCDGLATGMYSDWRLPTRAELQSLVDYSKSPGPTINTTFFVCQSSGYWSATTVSVHTEYVSYVHFSDGGVIANTKEVLYHVRCVR